MASTDDDDDDDDVVVVVVVVVVPPVSFDHFISASASASASSPFLGQPAKSGVSANISRFSLAEFPTKNAIILVVTVTGWGMDAT